jgi:hypothetical protein
MRNESLFAQYVVDIGRVARRALHLGLTEASIAKHLAREWFPPHSAQAGTPIRERHSHAVHQGNRIQKRGERMIHVSQQVAGAAYVDAKVRAAWTQRRIDTMENPSRVYLVVDCIEGGDEVKTLELSEGRGVAQFKTDISQTACAASARAPSILGAATSTPRNRLAGYACAIRLIARPCPQPTSSTSMP